MSKNKIIKFMHDETGLSYKECRKRLKENKWDLVRAMGYGEVLEKVSNAGIALAKSLKPAFDAICESCRRLTESIGKALSKVDWNEIAEAAKKMKEEAEQ